MITPWRSRSSSEKTLLIGLAILLTILFGLLSLTKGPLFGLLVVSIFIALPIGIVFLILAATMLALGVHELGHYAAGRMAGLEFYMLRIGPFSWRKLANKVKFSIEKSGQWSGGFASMGPTDNHNLLARHRWYVLGGPLASLILLGILAVCLPWREAFWGTHNNEGPWALGGRLIIVVVSIYAALYAAMSIIPYRYRGFYNDAAQLLLPLFSKEQAEYRVLAWKWAAEIGSGKRCADWDKEGLRELQNRATSPFEKASYAHCLGNSLLYSGLIEEGLSELEKGYAYLAKPTRLLVEYECAIALDTAFARAYFGKDVKGAQQALEKAESMKTRLDYGHHRAKAAISLLEADTEGVYQSVQEARKWLDENAEREKPVVEACYEEMDQLLAEAKEMATEAS